MRIWLAQSAVDQALAAGQVRLDGDLLALAVGEQLYLAPAVYFERLDEGDDAQQLVGCVKTAQELAQLGAEPAHDSVLLGDASYTVVPGFVGTVVGPGGTPTLLDPARWPALAGFLQTLGS